MITSENILSHEIIGLESEIIESSNQQVIGLNGTVVDETKSMFTLDTSKGFKKIPKKHNKWRFTIDETTVDVNGSLLTKRPQDRLGARA